MASCFKYLAALVDKHLTLSAPKFAYTPTPLEELTQRSMVELDMIPFILASGNGSMVKDISGIHQVIAIGRYSCIGFEFYRAYLSKDIGSFIHIAVDPRFPDEILECRIYQTENTISPAFATRQQQVLTLGENIDEAQNWEFWLLNNPDPNIGGMIGCPVMQGKNVYDAEGNIAYDPPQYIRSWVEGNQRIEPVQVTETVVDLNGNVTVFNHSMMHYGRGLSENIGEYLFVSAVETDDTADVNMWIGLDINPNDLKIFAVT